MRFTTLMIGGLVSFALAAPALSQGPKAGFSNKNGVVTTSQFVKTRAGGEEVSCQDFLGLSDQLKPQAVSYVLGMSKGRNPAVKVVDVTSVAKIVPVVVSTCRSRPKGALRDTVSTVLYQR
ncbi:HdeA/HdeB family chaperone [Sphingomonas faeni]|uniref:HdeA/HdeB family chaperone n=1 Tax=Sphingomonas faeni TaxID=185950 RepID=UPI0027807D50|nr:HdeA/HdeB family chaperone [Sphingomonas faeni]MDQ0839348.1 hypothetical protein [Sphingomonas faeni]